MSMDKYPSIMLRKMEAIIIRLLSSNIFRNTCSLKIREYPPIFLRFQNGNTWSRDAFRSIARERKYLVDLNSWYISLPSSTKRHREMTRFWVDCMQNVNHDDYFPNSYFKFISVSQVKLVSR